MRLFQRDHSFSCKQSNSFPFKHTTLGRALLSSLKENEMPKQKVKVGQEVKNKCPVCGYAKIYLPLSTFNKLHKAKEVIFECDQCDTEFWFNLRTGKITVKWVDKHVD